MGEPAVLGQKFAVGCFAYSGRAGDDDVWGGAHVCHKTYVSNSDMEGYKYLPKAHYFQRLELCKYFPRENLGGVKGAWRVVTPLFVLGGGEGRIIV